MTIATAEQIKCVEREIAMRKRVYPRWVENGKMKLDQAEYQIAAMEAVLVTLQRVAHTEELALE